MGLDKGQQEKLQRELEDRGENLTYKEIREIASEIKNGTWVYFLCYHQDNRDFFMDNNIIGKKCLSAQLKSGLYPN